MLGVAISEQAMLERGRSLAREREGKGKSHKAEEGRDRGDRGVKGFSTNWVPAAGAKVKVEVIREGIPTD